ncbi:MULTISPECIES: LysR family transcriptional regulator [unclassified Burkholderia]|uniref:LysR family transcriptional regulator n=1 Tax=unclassified Burkholderia TaxID=2613784 RepID=UPI000F55DE79|nr:MULTISPECIES: LysR family transcriptional regulator [unclassified Burkholderia]RQR68758.1 LysR family transcriptional regulator [Burkholderia sp. Bp9012]RQR70265.1 LysR family transcriptional regulator [Burkholderia sp. Bp9011]RQR83012.1 LysR family transcriptional regulator [Burkholderia sp. Bp9010]RQZ39421.1 LysR family transcriptional regulator [Burkholderia sp. Bp9099]
MKLHQLQALVAVADTGSIRGAARLTRLSQTAVSKALRELESQQQLTLLQRTASGVEFTEAGHKILRHARLILGQFEQVDAELAELRGDVSGRLVVSVAPWIIPTFLAELVLRFRERTPGVQLEIFESLTAVALPRLRDGIIDVMVGPLSATMSVQEFECEPLLDYHSCVIARHGHPCADRTSIHQLLDQNWVVNYTPATYSSMMRNLFWRHGATIESEHIHCAHSSSLMFELVEHGNMLGYCPQPYLVIEPIGSSLQALPLAERFDANHLNIITRRNAIRKSASKCFVDCLRDVIRQRSRSAAEKDRKLFDLLTLSF